MSNFQILVVEDDFLVAEEIQSNIEELGYEVMARVDNGKDAIQEVITNKADLAIMDIRIKGEMDGIETAAQLAKDHGVPIIYLTDQSDQETFERAKTTSPHAFLSKPFTAVDLQRSIQLAITQVYEEQKAKEKSQDDLDAGKIFKKHYMLKDRDGLHTIVFRDIIYLIADKQYCYLHTEDKNWHISRPMGKVLESLHQADYCKNNIIRINKSNCINLEKITKISGNKVSLSQHTFPIGKDGYHTALFEHIETI